MAAESDAERWIDTRLPALGVETERPLDHAGHLGLLGERVRLLLQRHIRRHAARLMRFDDHFGDTVVGPGELAAGCGWNRVESPEHSALDRLGAPSIEVCEARLKVLREHTAAEVERAGHDSLPLGGFEPRFGLGEAEFDMFLCAALPAVDTGLARLSAFAWSDFAVRRPTAGMLAELVATSPREELAALAALRAGPLVRHQLLRLAEHPSWSPETPLAHRLVHVPRRVVGLLVDPGRGIGAGLRGWRLVRPPRELVDVLPTALQAEAETLLSRPRPRVILCGPKGAGRATLVASTRKAALLEVDLAECLRGVDGDLLERLSRVAREARLLGVGLVLRFDELPKELEDALHLHQGSLHALFRDFPDALAATATRTDHRLDKLFPTAAELRVGVPPAAVQAQLWAAFLRPVLGDERADRLAPLLGRTYRLTPGAVGAAVASAVARNPNGAEGVGHDDIVRSVRSVLESDLGVMAELVASEATLDDIVLPEALQERYAEVLSFARHVDTLFDRWGFDRNAPTGRGLAVLFAGPPGTGKTLLASVMANALGRLIYKVDLSRIVDKYIGETEKNLGHIFDEAERAQAILLFDEADSLFARRTDVKSSNDRYANMKVNYLLQRLDSFRGVCVMTTNFGASLDDALERRVRFKLEFPMPEPEERAEIWQRLVPPDAPIEEDIDWPELGEVFEISGGHIRNAVMRASIQAIASDAPLDYELLFAAGVEECRSIGQLVRF